MGKHNKDGAQEYSGDRDQLHNDLRNLPTYQPENPPPYDKYTEKVAQNPNPKDRK